MTMNNYFDRQERVIGKEVGEKIKNTKILVVGAGAGGNEVLKNFTFLNRVLDSTTSFGSPEIPSGSPEEYSGFYFSQIHGI